MHHLLSAGTTAQDAANIWLLIERFARGLLVLLILVVFLLKRGVSWQHLVEIIVLLFLGVWVIPSMVPPKVSHIIANVNTGGAAGSTGISWGMLGLLFFVAALVFFAYR